MACGHLLVKGAIGPGVNPITDKKVVVAGATGLVGNAALRHFGGAGGGEIVVLSRRKPRELYGARHIQADLTDPAQCTQAATALQDTTHLVYAALYEAPNLIDGWGVAFNPNGFVWVNSALAG